MHLNFDTAFALIFQIMSLIKMKLFYNMLILIPILHEVQYNYLFLMNYALFWFRIYTLVHGSWDFLSRTTISCSLSVNYGKLVLQLHSWISFPIIKCKCPMLLFLLFRTIWGWRGGVLWTRTKFQYNQTLNVSILPFVNIFLLLYINKCHRVIHFNNIFYLLNSIDHNLIFQCYRNFKQSHLISLKCVKCIHVFSGVADPSILLPPFCGAAVYFPDLHIQKNSRDQRKNNWTNFVAV